MFNPIAMANMLQSVKNVYDKTKGVSNVFRNAFQKKQATTAEKIKRLDAQMPKKLTPKLTPQQQWNARKEQAIKSEKIRQKLNTGLNKKNPLPSPAPMSFNKPKDVNVGAKMDAFKKKQNKAIAKGLSNPVDYENKIKNIMGVK